MLKIVNTAFVRRHSPRQRLCLGHQLLLGSPIWGRWSRNDCVYDTAAYSTITTRNSEDVEVPCRSNGSITLNVHYPHQAPARAAPSRIILYLPCGLPLSTSGLKTRDHDDFIVQQLGAHTNATIVKVNYRIGDGYFHPTAVHDVLAGYDWVVTELARAHDSLSSSQSNRLSNHAKVGVCGQLLGGSLATMLALTECRMGSDRVVATAVNNPIGEWIFPTDIPDASADSSSLRFGTAEELAESAAIPKRRAKKVLRTSWEANADNAVLPASALIDARSKIFRRNAQWFDPFISPMLFFRSANVGIRLPGEIDPNQDKAAAVLNTDSATMLSSVVPVPEQEDYYDHELDLFNSPTETTGLSPPSSPDSSDTSFLVQAPEPLIARRRAHRIYPPQGSALRLPHMRISTALSSPLYDQAADLTKLMRRSLVRTTLRSHAHVHPDVDVLYDAEERADAVRAAERRVQLDVDENGGSEDAGLWTADAEGERRVRELGAWFDARLG